MTTTWTEQIALWSAGSLPSFRPVSRSRPLSDLAPPYTCPARSASLRFSWIARVRHLIQGELMRNQIPFTSGPSPGASDEVIVRLARLEEQMRHIVHAVEKLANRDAELDASLRAMSDRFTAALADQGETFRESVRQVCDK